MLRKTGYIILTSLLILSTVGFVVSRHYCDDMLVSVAIDSHADQCTSDMDGDCCHDESEYLVLKTDYTQPAVEKLTVAVIDVLDIELSTLLVEPSANLFHSTRQTGVCPIPGKHSYISVIQSFLL